MSTFSIAEAQARLPELIDQLQPGEELLITRGDLPVARLCAPPVPTGRPIYGRGKGKVLLHVDDDSHLDDFKEYM